MTRTDGLIPKHGGYRNLKSFQIAQLVYDLTDLFCDRYIDRRSRTRDQMVQAARSGTQNIAEASQASGTSKKMELKLTNVARASMEELRLDYEDFLRQRGLGQWPPDDPALRRFKARRCATLEQVRAWVEEEHTSERGGGGRTVTDEHGPTRTNTSGQDRPIPDGHVGTGGVAKPPTYAQLVANAALSLLNLCCYLLDRQIASQAAAFEREGGFTERLYRVRSEGRRNSR